MAVLIEAISVVIKAKQLLEKFPGGWDKFMVDTPNQTLCADGEIVRLGFMSPQAVKNYINILENIGLIYLSKDNSIDIVVVDQNKGPMYRCNCIEYGKINLENNPNMIISACRLAGSQINQIITPDYWVYKNSLSDKYTFIESKYYFNRLQN